jgi:hypothetical protein
LDDPYLRIPPSKLIVPEALPNAAGESAWVIATARFVVPEYVLAPLRVIWPAPTRDIELATEEEITPAYVKAAP